MKKSIFLEIFQQFFLMAVEIFRSRLGIEFDLFQSDKSVNKIHPNRIKII